jgi:hypothetical protein
MYARKGDLGIEHRIWDSGRGSIKNVHIANESCCKYEKVSIKNTLYFERSKKDKFGKILESLACSRWMESVGWMGDPVMPPRSSIDSIFIVVIALLGTVS